MSQAKMSALVQYCGHDGVFIADIWRIGDVNVVKANGPVSPENILRGKQHLKNATHHLVDFPHAGYWKPQEGIFVVPENQVETL